MSQEDDDMPEWEREALEEHEYNRAGQNTQNAARAVINAAYRNRYSDKSIISNDDITNLRIDIGLSRDVTDFIYRIGYGEFGRNARRVVDDAERKARNWPQSIKKNI